MASPPSAQTTLFKTFFSLTASTHARKVAAAAPTQISPTRKPGKGASRRDVSPSKAEDGNSFPWAICLSRFPGRPRDSFEHRQKALRHDRCRLDAPRPEISWSTLQQQQSRAAVRSEISPGGCLVGAPPWLVAQPASSHGRRRWLALWTAFAQRCV